MCTCQPLRRAWPSRRGLLVGLGAGLGAAVASAGARATPFAACWSPAELAGTAAERLRRHPTAADAFVTPEPAAPGQAVTGSFAGVIRRVELPADQKLIALTFDLCQTTSPIAGYDGAIVDYLRHERVPATFFAGGRWLKTHAARGEELAADPLFALGNHSWSHPDLHFASAEAVANEVLLCEAALAETRAAASAACPASVTAASPPRLFRFPYGSCAPASLAAANAVGAVVIQWDVVSGDPDGTPAAAIERNVLSAARPGSIVVMHANGRGTHTAEALRTIVPKLRGEGYSFVAVTDLLGAGRPEATTACYIERPGDTGRYDRVAGLHHQRSTPASVVR